MCVWNRWMTLITRTWTLDDADLPVFEGWVRGGSGRPNELKITNKMEPTRPGGHFGLLPGEGGGVG
jgi:hypothetical protein